MRKQNSKKCQYSLSIKVSESQDELNMEFQFLGEGIDAFPDHVILSSLTKCLGKLSFDSKTDKNNNFLLS